MIPHLSGAALAIDLPGRGNSPADLETVTLDDWVDAIIQTIAGISSEKIVLVGHSLAGMSLPRVAARIPERLERLIFISCSIPPEGRSVIDILSPEIRPLAEKSLANRGTSMLPEDTARSMFCSDMNPEQTRFVLDRLVPEAWSPLLEPSRLAGLECDIPATYIKLQKDAVLAPTLQDQMIANLGAIEVAELDAGHDAMISSPEALAQLINRLVGR
jgi:pimeloyl-ACP methyl ester carboxylesterase